MILTLFAAELSAQKNKTVGLPPLIDREIFFGNPEISGAQLSPNGKWMSFIKPYKGTRNIWVKKAEAAFETARPLTADTLRPISAYFWSHDSKYILYVQDKGGDENYQVYAVNPIEKPAEEQEVPFSRNLTNSEKCRAFIYHLPKKYPDIIYLGLNDRDPAWHDLYELRISTGELKLLRENTERYLSWIFDRSDKLRLAVRSNEDGSTDLLRIDAKKMEIIYTTGILESSDVLRFHEDGKRVYMVTNKGAGVDLTKLVLFDIFTKSEELVESDPKKRVDFGYAMFSDVNNQLIATVYEDDKSRYYFRDKEYEAEYNALKKEFKGKEVTFSNSTKDERQWLIVVWSDTDNGSVYLYNRNTKKTVFQYRPRPQLPTDDLAPMQIIQYKSSDGLAIPAYLTLPKGIPPKKLPLIVHPHGGPWARDSWGYDPYAQFFANRGYAVLQMNFRGSTGYGKKFLDAGNKQWGDKMQDDITWGVKHLVSRGIVDPARVGIFGGSYGGYAALAGLAFTPDVYACGVSLVGPSSLLTLLESIPPYWEAGRKIFHERMGDPTNEAGKNQLMRQSPLFSVDKIKVPLLVVQGANDPRVKKAESDQIVVAMRDKGLGVEYICAPDEGHGFQRPENNMAFVAASEKFFAKHLGGRYQETMTDAVAKRLQEITVDIATVTLPKKIEMDEMQANLARAVRDLRAGSYSYQIHMEVMGQKMDFDQNIQVLDNGLEWRIIEQTNVPMGEVKDIAAVAKNSLRLLSRSTDQGPVNIQLSYSENEAKGRINMNGQISDVSIKTSGYCIGDGPGSVLVFSCLPLDDRYSAFIRTVDVQKMKEKMYTFRVVGREIVDGLSCFKAEVKPANGDPGEQTYWISDEPAPRTVKFNMVIPELMGAVMSGKLK